MKKVEKTLAKKERKVTKKAHKVYKKCLKTIAKDKHRWTPEIHVEIPEDSDFSMKNIAPIVVVGNKRFKLQDRLVGFQLIELMKKEGFLIFSEKSSSHIGDYFSYYCYYLLDQH